MLAAVPRRHRRDRRVPRASRRHSTTSSSRAGWAGRRTTSRARRSRRRSESCEASSCGWPAACASRSRRKGLGEYAARWALPARRRRADREPARRRPGIRAGERLRHAGAPERDGGDVRLVRSSASRAGRSAAGGAATAPVKGRSSRCSRRRRGAIPGQRRQLPALPRRRPAGRRRAEVGRRQPRSRARRAGSRPGAGRSAAPDDASASGRHRATRSLPSPSWPSSRRSSTWRGSIPPSWLRSARRKGRFSSSRAPAPGRPGCSPIGSPISLRPWE